MKGIAMRRAGLAGLALAVGSLLPWTAPAADGLMAVDYKGLVSRADIAYDKPAERSEAGLPVGNGRMGSLVWTTPAALKFQINRVDVFATHCGTTSFARGETVTVVPQGATPSPKNVS